MELRRLVEVSLKRSNGESGSPIAKNTTPMIDHMSQSRAFIKKSKLECPRFDKSDFFGWHSKIIQFFQADATPENDKINTVMMHLDGRALQWHLHYMRTMELTVEVVWFTYLFAMRERFGCNEYMKPFAQLVALKQTDLLMSFSMLLRLC
ncbi:hypothetical protein COLO4_32073 [Corchorus olitorius]|uniref:Retrotransposon gag protein n=1 Tax=Corchorus olitorius TaxID=93759 RepID=A0A1R3H209_9ROSI|nr:hypothetical protein COLO4_32073 [Corchorus olitorius]